MLDALRERGLVHERAYLDHLGLLSALIAAVIVGTVIGRKVLARLPKRVFTWIFEGVLATVAVYLIAA